MNGSGHVLLVGATQGLGLALAARYLEEGYRVTATTLVPSLALDTLHEPFGDRLRVLPFDITDPAQAERLYRDLAGETIDIVHILAGFLPPEDVPVWQQDDAMILRVLKTNALGSVRLANRLESLVPEGGAFIFTSSGMGSMVRNTLAGADLYRISKAALNMLVRSFAVTHGAKRAVVLTCPGWAKTEMGGPLATVEVADSVEGLLRIATTARPNADGAPFLEYTGDTVPW